MPGVTNSRPFEQDGPYLRSVSIPETTNKRPPQYDLHFKDNSPAGYERTAGFNNSIVLRTVFWGRGWPVSVSASPVESIFLVRAGAVHPIVRLLRSQAGRPHPEEVLVANRQVASMRHRSIVHHSQLP
jgi:hypothetical protein